VRHIPVTKNIYLYHNCARDILTPPSGNSKITLIDSIHDRMPMSTECGHAEYMSAKKE